MRSIIEGCYERDTAVRVTGAVMGRVGDMVFIAGGISGCATGSIGCHSR